MRLLSLRELTCGQNARRAIATHLAEDVVGSDALHFRLELHARFEQVFRGRQLGDRIGFRVYGTGGRTGGSGHLSGHRGFEFFLQVGVDGHLRGGDFDRISRRAGRSDERRDARGGNLFLSEWNGDQTRHRFGLSRIDGRIQTGTAGAE